MKREDIELLQKIQKNTEMGLHALETLSGKVYDDNLALQLTRESFRYGQLRDQARAALVAGKEKPLPENKVSNLMLSASIQGNLLLNSSTSRIAEMMIRGSNMGVTQLWKALNHNEAAGEKPKSLARELMDFEENNIKELKKYL